MKKGWEYKTLGEIATDMYRGSGIKRDQITKSGIPCIRYGEIYTTYNISFEECVSHTNESLISQKKYFENGDILFAITGESVEDIGKCVAYTGHQKCLLGGDIVAMKHNQCPKYLAYALSTQDAIRQKGIGKTKLKVVHTNIPALKTIRILLPKEISAQEEIVSYLDTTFANIDNLKSNASKALSEAKALFQAALAEAMMPKEGWEEKTLGEIAEIKGGKRVPKGYSLSTIPTKHKYIRVADFNDNGTVDIKSVLYISDDVYNQIKRYTISSKDVYVSIAGTIGKTGIIPKELDGANLTENACKLSLKTDVDKFFLYYFTKSKLFIDQINELTRKSAQPKLALTRLAKVVIPYPSISQQHQIVRHLDSLSSKVRQMEENYRKTLAECDALKQAILRDVFE